MSLFTVTTSSELHQYTQLTRWQPTAYERHWEFVSCHFFTDQQTILMWMTRVVLVGSYDIHWDFDNIFTFTCRFWRSPYVPIELSTWLSWHGFLPFGSGSCQYVYRNGKVLMVFHALFAGFVSCESFTMRFLGHLFKCVYPKSSELHLLGWSNAVLVTLILTAVWSGAWKHQWCGWVSVKYTHVSCTSWVAYLLGWRLYSQVVCSLSPGMEPIGISR